MRFDSIRHRILRIESNRISRQVRSSSMQLASEREFRFAGEFVRFDSIRWVEMRVRFVRIELAACKSNFSRLVWLALRARTHSKMAPESGPKRVSYVSESIGARLPVD